MSRSDGERIRIGRMGAMARAVLEVALSGPRGEPVDLWRTIVSHGVADLPPGTIDESARTYETTLPLGRTRPRTIRIREGGRGKALVEVLGPPLSEAGRERITRAVRRMLNLDEDLSAFYEVASADSQLSWAVDGAGRMLRSPTVFEDVVKTRFPLSERSAIARFMSSIETLGLELVSKVIRESEYTSDSVRTVLAEGTAWAEELLKERPESLYRLYPWREDAGGGEAPGEPMQKPA
jgi:hypothetical protein